MEDRLKEELERKCVERAGEAVKFAVQRNIVAMLHEIEHRLGMEADNDNGNGDENIMTIRLSVVHERYYTAKIKVKDCSWNRKITFKDDDFPEDDIDARQLDMFDEFDKANAKEAVSNEDVWMDSTMRYNLMHAAAEIGADYYEVCRDPGVPSHEQTIDRVSPNGEHLRKLAPSNRIGEILEAAADQGGIVLLPDGTMPSASIVKLLRNGYDVYGYIDDVVRNYVEGEVGVELGELSRKSAKELLAEGAVVVYDFL